MQEGGRTPSEALAFLPLFFAGVGVLVGEVLGVKVFVNASPLLGGWVHPARSEQSESFSARNCFKYCKVAGSIFASSSSSLFSSIVFSTKDIA